MSTRDHPDWWEPMGGQNSQDSILERRSLIWNDNDILDGVDPPAFYHEVDYKGKFYTRGCRGMIEQLQIYCRGAVADGITLRYSPHPCLGPINTVTITPLAGWAWRGVAIEEMWNYDSLFIWVSSIKVGVDWAYDAVQPHDGHWSQDAGATWEDMAIRPFIRAVYTGETPGDVPVSGIVNTIRIPNDAVGTGGGLVALPDLTWADLIDIDGAGELVQVEVDFQTAVVPAPAVQYALSIWVDGVEFIRFYNRQLTQSVIATFGRCALGEFLQEAALTRMWVHLPIPFRRNILLRAWQQTGAATFATGAIRTTLLV